MAKQEKCKQALAEIASAVNNMYKPLPTGQAAIDAGREVAAKIRKQLEENDRKVFCDHPDCRGYYLPHEH